MKLSYLILSLPIFLLSTIGQKNMSEIRKAYTQQPKTQNIQQVHIPYPYGITDKNRESWANMYLAEHFKKEARALRKADRESRKAQPESVLRERKRQIKRVSEAFSRMGYVQSIECTFYHDDGLLYVEIYGFKSSITFDLKLPHKIKSLLPEYPVRHKEQNIEGLPFKRFAKILSENVEHVMNMGLNLGRDRTRGFKVSGQFSKIDDLLDFVIDFDKNARREKSKSVAL